MVEVASTELTFNGLQNQWLKNAPKNVAPKVAPRFLWLVRTFYNVSYRSIFLTLNRYPLTLSKLSFKQIFICPAYWSSKKSGHPEYNRFNISLDLAHWIRFVYAFFMDNTLAWEQVELSSWFLWLAGSFLQLSSLIACIFLRSFWDTVTAFYWWHWWRCLSGPWDQLLARQASS